MIFKRIILMTIAAGSLYFSSGCAELIKLPFEAIGAAAELTNETLKLTTEVATIGIGAVVSAASPYNKEDKKKDNSFPSAEKTLVSIPYTVDGAGRVNYKKTDETIKANNERLVPYNRKWVPWEEKKAGLYPIDKVDLDRKEKVYRDAESKMQEMTKSYENNRLSLSELEEALDRFRNNALKPYLEAKQKYEKTKKEFDSK